MPTLWITTRTSACAYLGFLAFALAGCDPLPGEDSTDWEPAFDAASTGWLLSVWGPSADDLYSVGGEPAAGVVVHFDGSSWQNVDTQLAVPLLNWVFGFGSDNVVAVGNNGTIVRYDGATWTSETTPTDQDLWGVWGASADDLWAVGGRGRTDGDATILRYDGTTWTQVTIPTLQKANVRAFYKVWGTAADNVYIVGQNGAVLRWDGTQLNEELVGASDDLIALWGTGPDRIVIVGGRGNGIVTTWDGTTWETKNLAPLPGLNGVWLRDDAVAHVVGGLGTVATIDIASLTATKVSSSDGIDTPHDMHAIFGDSSGQLTTVGGSLRQPFAPFIGVAYTRGLNDGE
ncbi:MAG: hypothetical protein ACI9MR_005272 [Myxococcota bacterium]|jgi:hypothetical protein